jgi:heptosyltransferase-2
MEFNEVRRDCLYFKGHIPCKPNKEDGSVCGTCSHYKPIEKRILIIKLGALGDVIRTTPLLEKFRRKYPNSHITWLTLSPEILPRKSIDVIYSLSGTSLFILENSLFDIAVNLDKDPEACILMSKIEAVQKFGFTWEDHAVAPCTQAAEHKLMTGFFDQLSRVNTKNYLQEIFEICHLSFEQEPYDISLNEEKSAEWHKILKEKAEGRLIVGLNTGCGPRWNTRLWREDHWMDLAKILVDHGYFPMFLGGNLEHEKNERMSKTNGIFYPGHFDLETFISLTSACDIVITQVTMMMHIATALQKKMVLMNTIFNPNEFELYGRGAIVGPTKECVCYYGNTCSLGTPCMDTITPHAVLEALKSLT